MQSKQETKKPSKSNAGRLLPSVMVLAITALTLAPGTQAGPDDPLPLELCEPPTEESWVAYCITIGSPQTHEVVDLNKDPHTEPWCVTPTICVDVPHPEGLLVPKVITVATGGSIAIWHNTGEAYDDICDTLHEYDVCEPDMPFVFRFADANFDGLADGIVVNELYLGA